MQQNCSAIYVILLLLLGSGQHHHPFATAQVANISGSSPAPGSGVGSSTVTSPAAAGSTNTSGSTNSTPVISPGVTSSPTPGTVGSGTTTNTSSGTSGATPGATQLTPGSTPAGGVSSPVPGDTRNPASPGSAMSAAYVMPMPDETAIEVKSRDECILLSELFGRMSANQTGPTACPGQGSGNSAGNGKTQTLNEYKGSRQISSSSNNREGLVTTSVGSQFCVSPEGAEAIAAEANKLSFSSTGSLVRELPDIYDPSCDDPDADLRQGCPDSSALPPSFYTDATVNSGDSNPNPGDSTKDASTADVPASPDAKQQLADCTRKFLRVGSAPRSVAIILLKWDRKYYKSKEDCCTEQGNPPNCDCNWSGYTYDNLPPPKAYSRYFTDECDLGPSVNRGYYDMSGGKVTFHSKLRVPTPRGAIYETAPKPGVSPSPDSSTPPPQPPAQATAVPNQPIETANSYLDPEGVDVYGWATLSDMRAESGLCNDWCGDAMRQLNVNDKDYNHVICLQLLASKALCDVCKGDCVGTCPAATGITTGCGCATCYYAWGGQASCHRPSAPGIRVGMGANSRTYDGEMLANAGGPFISVSEQIKRFVTHEIGHNMGLTHTGSIKCKVDGDSSILREPQQCRPDWYGDSTSFMGNGGTMLVPNAIKYKVRWLPRYTLRTHPQGEERTYILRAGTTRRPSWQSKAPSRLFTREDTLAVRVQLRNPPGSKQDVSSYSCPCSAGGACPSCTSSNPGACDNGPCCLDESCADVGLNWLYIELHQPYRNDYAATTSGIAIRMMGEMTNCTSTRLVPVYASGGRANYLLTQPDRAGQKPGSKYEDVFRGVRVVFESWDRARAVVRVWSA